MVKTPQNKALTNTQAKAIKAQKAQLEAIKAAEKALAENPSEPAENIFLQAVKNTRPLNIDVPFTEKTYPKPIAKQFIRDEQQALRDSLSDDFYPAHELESGEELLYLRTGQSPDVLSKLRRGFWVVQAQIDLHGLISDEAREYVAEFLSSCKKRNIRCVRIVHGKGLGSRNREPVLKHKLRNWLMQKDEVIAYAQAKPEDGGSGAVIVLLKA
jgi:DNA-nicking Smr family endonuclease